MPCDILDLRCVVVNELVGSAFLAVLIFSIIYFIVASKLKWGFDTTIVFGAATVILIGLAISSFPAILAFTTLIVVLMLVWIFNIIIGNR